MSGETHRRAVPPYHGEEVNILMILVYGMAIEPTTVMLHFHACDPAPRRDSLDLINLLYI